MKHGVIRLVTILGTAVLLTVQAVPASAAMYGVNASGEIFLIDVTTGDGTSRGSLPLSGAAACCDGYNEIAFDASTGTAWAQERDGNFRAHSFDLASNSATSAFVPNDASWHAWEFIGPTLYAAGFAGVVQNGLATMDPAIGTPSVSVIVDGTWDAILQGQVFTGLAFDGVTLFGITNGGGDRDNGDETVLEVLDSQLYSIDTSTGALSLIGGTGIRAGSLEFGDDDKLYAGGVSQQAGGFFEVNKLTGVATFIGDTGFGSGGGISGLMRAPFVEYTGPLPTAPVPAYSGWTIALLILLIGMIALIHRRVNYAA